MLYGQIIDLKIPDLDYKNNSENVTEESDRFIERMYNGYFYGLPVPPFALCERKA